MLSGLTLHESLGLLNRELMKRVFAFIVMISFAFMLQAQIDADSISSDSLGIIKDHAYYLDEYRDASINFHVGLGLLATGTAGIVGGSILVSSEGGDDFYDSGPAFGWGVGLIIISVPALAIGTVMAINGGMRREKANKAIEEINGQLSLGLKVNRNGISLVLRF